MYVDGLVLRDRDTDGNGSLDERLYALQDANWNTTGLVNAGGTVQERYTYAPFGQVTFRDGSGSTLSGSAKDWVFLHQGGERIAAGDYEFRNRVYSPTLGRWLSNDPLGFEAGDQNWYRAIGNNPGNGNDPSGLDVAVLAMGNALESLIAETGYLVGEIGTAIRPLVPAIQRTGTAGLVIWTAIEGYKEGGRLEEIGNIGGRLGDWFFPLPPGSIVKPPIGIGSGSPPLPIEAYLPPSRPPYPGPPPIDEIRYPNQTGNIGNLGGLVTTGVGTLIGLWKLYNQLTDLEETIRNAAEHVVRDHKERFGENVEKVVDMIKEVVEKGPTLPTLTGAIIAHWAGKTVILHPQQKKGTMEDDPTRNGLKTMIRQNGTK